MLLSAEVALLPHTALLPQTALKPVLLLFPQTALLPHTAELPHIAELPHMAELPHIAEESEIKLTIWVAGSKETLGDIAVMLAGAKSLLFKAAWMSMYPAPTVKASYWSV